MSDPPPPGPAQFGNLEANLQFIAATGVLRPGVRVLEIGTGTGTLLGRLRAQGYDVRGVERNPALIEEGRRWQPDLPVELVSGVTLPFADGTFDIVMSFDVFEHIPDSDSHLGEVRRVLRPDGSYLVQTPNKWMNSVFETIRWRSFTRWRVDHCSLHTLGDLRRRFATHGFRLQAYDIAVVNDFFREKVRRYAGWPGTAALAIVNPDRLPLSWRTNLYVAATRVEGGA